MLHGLWLAGPGSKVVAGQPENPIFTRVLDPKVKAVVGTDLKSSISAGISVRRLQGSRSTRSVPSSSIAMIAELPVQGLGCEEGKTETAPGASDIQPRALIAELAVER